MKVTGVIAEYNPFHNGHQYQFDQIRKNGSDFIIVVMSGDYVQRGTPAIFSKYLRTRTALLCGADLVLELPVQVSCASAEFFASGAVSILDRLGVVDELCFGAEKDDALLFLKTAQILNEEPLEYKTALKEALKTGLSFPAARVSALLHFLPESEEFLSSPNNILGMEYCRSLLKRNSSITPAPLLRVGASYHEKDCTNGSFPSASALREKIYSSNFNSEDLRSFVPEAAYSLYREALQNQAYLHISSFDQILPYALWNETTQSLQQYADVSAELASRIVKSLPEYRNTEKFIQLLKTKELTYTRISRALLHIVLKITETPHELSYARVLGFRKSSEQLLSEIKKRGDLPLLSKAANAGKMLDANSLKIFDKNTLASNLYESILSKEEDRAFVHEYQKQLIII